MQTAFETLTWRLGMLHYSVHAETQGWMGI